MGKIGYIKLKRQRENDYSREKIKGRDKSDAHFSYWKSNVINDVTNCSQGALSINKVPLLLIY